MATMIAHNAVIDPRADIADDVEIGPFCIVGPHVTIGRGTRLENHVTVMGRVTIGQFNHIFPNVVIGAEPQDLSYQGSDTQVVIGDHNTIREGVTINRASEKEEGITSIGDGCYLMACCHVAHDCRIGDGVVIANGTLLGGHVHIHDHANLSGGVGVHHFTTIGSYSFISGLSRVMHDVPPYMLADGSPCRPRCVNLVALKRHAFPEADIRALSEAHRLLYRAQVGLEQARETLRQRGLLLPCVVRLLDFIRNQRDGRHGRARERRRAA